MDEVCERCRALAEDLAAAEELSLPADLPCRALDLMVELHAIVTQAMGSDLARAGRAAEASWLVAHRFPNDPLLFAQAHWSRASAILYIPDYAGALAHYDQALDWYRRACEACAPDLPGRDIRVVQVVRVFCLSELGRYNEALRAVELAEEWLSLHPHPTAQLKLLLNRSQLAGRMGDYAGMLARADATIDVAQRVGDAATTSHAWNNRAYACIMLGRFDEASAALDSSALAAQQSNEALTLWRVDLNRALLYRFRGQLFEALKLLRVVEQQLAQVPNEAAIVALQEAEIYEQLYQLRDAQAAANRAADLFAQQLMPIYGAAAALRAVQIAVGRDKASVAHAMLAKAMSQIEHVELPTLRAEIALSQALITTLPTGSKGKPTQAARRAARTQATSAIRTLAASGLHLEAAKGQLVVATLAIQLGDLPAAQAIYRDLLDHSSQPVQLAAHAGLGALLPAGEGLPYLEHAAHSAVQQRRALPMEELQARYSSETSPYHVRLAACHLDRGDPAAAFESICAAKAGPLLDLRAAKATLDDETLARLEVAKANLAHWRRHAQEHERAAGDARSTKERDQLLQLAAAAQTQARASEQQLTNLMRLLGDRSGQAAVPGVEAIRQVLAPGMILLEYAQRGEELICFLLQPGQPLACQQLGSYRALLPLLDHWNVLRWGLRRSPTPDAHERLQLILRRLWAALLEPLSAALHGSHHVLIAPWGMLYQVPWAALFDGVAHLADMGTLTLTPSAGLWAAPAVPADGPPGPPRVLAFPGIGARRLAHVDDEIATIRHHLPHAHISTRATAADLRALPPPEILHIAAHGSTNSEAPLFSTLELADGPFLLLQAHRLNLRGTRLVALSACETGARPDYGDMTLALAGAFLCAGAQVVLASLWEVDDAATAAVMDHFYAALASGSAPAEALRRAQIGTRPDHPLDWAAFQVWSAAFNSKEHDH